MSDSIDKMLQKFNSIEELQKYCEIQFKTINAQSKRINEMQDESVKLKAEIEKLTRELTVQAAQKASSLQTTDEETTCIVQLAMIRQLAMNRELTVDETRKFEIFAKTLNMIRGKAIKKEEEPTKKMSNEELLALIDNTISEKQ